MDYVRILLLFPSLHPVLMYLPLAGQNMCSTAQKFCLLPREFLSCRGSITLTPARRRFPNPIPSGTRVPQWALLDVTVCFLAFFLDNILTTRSRTRTIGTLTDRMPSVVGTFSRLFSRYCLTVTPAFCFHRLTRAGSWHNNRPFKLLRLEQLYLEYSHVEYRHVE